MLLRTLHFLSEIDNRAPHFRGLRKYYIEMVGVKDEHILFHVKKLID